jgi:hypothetical protein
VVVDDLSQALDLIGQGRDVVLIVAPGDPAVHLSGRGPGRLAIFVGDPCSPEVRGAAEAMERELFSRSGPGQPTIRQ